MKTDTVYSSVFVLRALCAILIVLAHSTLPCHDLLTPLIRVAVPVFFMMSGYFIWSPSHAGVQDKVVRKIKDIAWVTLYANVLYILLAIVLHLLDPRTELPLTSLKSWFLLLFFGTGVCLPLWYLTAFLQTLIVFYIVLRLRRELTFIKLAPWLLILTLGVGMYGSVFGLEGIPYTIKVNFLMEGIPFFCLGYAIQEYQPQIMEVITPRRSLWLAGVIFVLSFCEMALLRRYTAGVDLDYTNTVYLTTPLLATSVFLMCLLHPQTGRHSYLRIIGRDLSTDIYLWHFMFFLILFTFFRTPFIVEYSFLVILPCSLLLAYVVSRLRQHFQK